MHSICIVEDEPMIARILVDKMQREGFRVISKPTGAEGLAAIRGEKPDLVLLDLTLDDQDGLEVLSQLKADPDGSVRQIPVLMLVGQFREGDVPRAKELGALDCILKPFKPTIVAARIRHILGTDY
ncbi:MAG: response regulator [Acidobacteria bacterium]|nr:response regulator [Acidobacteriota bacterium]